METTLSKPKASPDINRYLKMYGSAKSSVCASCPYADNCKGEKGEGVGKKECFDTQHRNIFG